MIYLMLLVIVVVIVIVVLFIRESENVIIIIITIITIIIIISISIATTTTAITFSSSTPSIAQLVERWTVVVQKQTSIGHWFESGSKDILLLVNISLSLSRLSGTKWFGQAVVVMVVVVV